MTDYPLRYYTGKVRLAVLVAVIGTLAWFKVGSGTVTHQRAQARAKRRRRQGEKRGRRGVESSDSSSYSSSEEERGDNGRNVGLDGKGVRRKRSVSSGYWVNQSGRNGDGYGTRNWSNQTRLRGSVRFSEGDGRGREGSEAKKKRLAWLRPRRKRGVKEALDEETGGV